MQLHWHEAELELAPLALSVMTNSQLCDDRIRFRPRRARWLSGAWAMLRKWRRRTFERAELARLSTHDLHDIGVSQAEAWAETQKWFWQE